MQVFFNCFQAPCKRPTIRPYSPVAQSQKKKHYKVLEMKCNKRARNNPKKLWIVELLWIFFGRITLNGRSTLSLNFSLNLNFVLHDIFPRHTYGCFFFIYFRIIFIIINETWFYWSNSPKAYNLKRLHKTFKKKHFQWWQFSSYKTQSLLFLNLQNSTSSHVQLYQVKFLKFQHKLGLLGAMGGGGSPGWWSNLWIGTI